VIYYCYVIASNFNLCSFIKYFMLLIHPCNCEGLARTTKTRHLLVVRYHKRRQTLRLMLSWIFQMLLLMKLTMMDRTQKVLNLCLVHFLCYSFKSYCAPIISAFYNALLHLFCCVASRAPSWTHVRTNSFLHRNRRNQSIDEVCAELLIH
jgi:hypothetical protein